MTDKDALFSYRMHQAEETLADAKVMLKEEFGPRSIVNRAYYAMFYALLALFIKTDIPVKTSKHIGAISLFDREFVGKGKLERSLSTILHDAFDDRLEGDYREFVHLSHDDAVKAVSRAQEFIGAIKRYVGA